MRITGIATITLVILLFFLTDILRWGFGSNEFWYRPYLIWLFVIVMSTAIHKALYRPDDA